MPGRDNLIPVQSGEEAREKGRRGGIASGIARRRKRDAKAAARMVLSLRPELNDSTADGLARLGLDPDEQPDVQTLILITMAQLAMKGDLAAAMKILELSGYKDARTQIEFERLKLEREKQSAGDDSAAAILSKAAEILGGIESAVK